MTAATTLSPLQERLLLTRNAFRLRAEQMGRVISRRRLHLVRIDEMLAMAEDWAHELDGRFDGVAALPRSGLMVGSILAESLRLPITTPDLMRKGKMLHGGGDPLSLRRLLLVDDSVSSGTQMREAVASLHALPGERTITTAALLPHEDSTHLVDEHYRVIRHPRLFEWDIVHTKKVRSIAFDMDGVLCEDVDDFESIGEDRYVDLIENCRPFLLPRYEIDHIVTNRLEKYREPTERWLLRHGISYRHLVMWDLPDAGHRRGRFAQNKARQILKVRPRLFVESSFWQARKIWAVTGVPTLCTDTMTLLG